MRRSLKPTGCSRFRFVAGRWIFLSAAVGLFLLGVLDRSPGFDSDRESPRPPARFLEEPPDPAISRDDLLEHIKFFSSDGMGGREAGSDGARRAAQYIADHFADVGLEPVGDDGTYFQNFELPREFIVLPSSKVVASRGKRNAGFRLDQDFSLVSSSAPGTVQAEAVFAGYGIAAPEKEYDDYEGLDVAGKVVVVFRRGPRFEDSRGPFSGKSARDRYCSLKAKLETAQGAGAAALVVINDPLSVKKSRKDLLDGDGGKERGKIPFVQMTAKAGARLAAVGKISLSGIQKKIDKALKPMSRKLQDVEIQVRADLERKTLPVRNVVGMLRGKGQDKTDEVLIVGAHFDHVGFGSFGSLGGSSARGKVHNGADDNASGSSGLLEIAAFMAPHDWELRRDVLFIAFTAEEMGLLGSVHYVDEPLVPLANTAAMVNLDMIGRLRREELFIGGVGTSPVFPEILVEQNRSVRVPVRFGEGGIAPTDSATFYRKRIPVLFFFTGLHSDYHRPADDWNRVDVKGQEKIVRLAAETSLEIGRRRSRPPFQQAESGGFSSGGPSLGMGFEQKEDGVYVATLVSRGVARKAGVRKGDKLVELDGQPIRSVSDYYSLESNLAEGGKSELVLRRRGRLRTLKFRVPSS